MKGTSLSSATTSKRISLSPNRKATPAQAARGDVATSPLTGRACKQL